MSCRFEDVSARRFEPRRGEALLLEIEGGVHNHLLGRAVGALLGTGSTTHRRTTDINRDQACPSHVRDGMPEQGPVRVRSTIGAHEARQSLSTRFKVWPLSTLAFEGCASS